MYVKFKVSVIWKLSSYIANSSEDRFLHLVFHTRARNAIFILFLLISASSYFLLTIFSTDMLLILKLSSIHSSFREIRNYEAGKMSVGV